MLTDRRSLERAVGDLAICKFFPSDPAARSAIMELLARMCPSQKALDWLTRAMVDRVGEWHGPVELRGVLCWKFRPADGVEASCIDTPGFRVSDAEGAALERQAVMKSGGYGEIADESRNFVAEMASKVKRLQ